MKKKCAIDESLFVHIDGKQLWVIGIIDIQSLNIRIEVSFYKDTTTMKKIISKYIEQGNIIISDPWPAYNFLDDANSDYRHITHNHSIGSFGVGSNSSAYIENSWANLKDKIKKLYYNIQNSNFILFLKESEWRRNNIYKSKSEKIKDIIDIFKYVNDTAINLYSIEELMII